jgi:hypothetical protein
MVGIVNILDVKFKKKTEIYEALFVFKLVQFWFRLNTKNVFFVGFIFYLIELNS